MPHSRIGIIAYPRLRHIALLIPSLSNYTLSTKNQQVFPNRIFSEITMSKTKTRIQERRQKERQHKMLITMLAVGLLLIISGVFFAKNTLENQPDPSLIEVSGQPSLKVDQDQINYGDVKLNTNLQFKLELTNVGDQPLRISEAPYVEVVDGC